MNLLIISIKIICKIPQISFEDSQVDHFIPYSSPTVLNWDACKKSFSNASIDQHNLSEIEQARGNGDASSTIQLTQLPIGINKNLIFHFYKIYFS